MNDYPSRQTRVFLLPDDGLPIEDRDELKRIVRGLVARPPSTLLVRLAIADIGIQIIGEVAASDLAVLIGDFQSCVELADLVLRGPRAPKPGAETPPTASQEGERSRPSGSDPRGPHLAAAADAAASQKGGGE